MRAWLSRAPSLLSCFDVDQLPLLAAGCCVGVVVLRLGSGEIMYPAFAAAWAFYTWLERRKVRALETKLAAGDVGYVAGYSKGWDSAVADIQRRALEQGIVIQIVKPASGDTRSAN